MRWFAELSGMSGPLAGFGILELGSTVAGPDLRAMMLGLWVWLGWPSGFTTNPPLWELR